MAVAMSPFRALSPLSDSFVPRWLPERRPVGDLPANRLGAPGAARAPVRVGPKTTADSWCETPGPRGWTPWCETPGPRGWAPGCETPGPRSGAPGCETLDPKVKPSPPGALVSCDWCCGFRISLGQLLAKLGDDPDVLSRCELYGYDPAAPGALLDFICDANPPVPPQETPLEALFASLCRWWGAEPRPAVFCDSGLTPGLLFRSALFSRGAAPVWLAAPRRCRCLTMFTASGQEVAVRPSEFAPPGFLSPVTEREASGAAVRLTCTDGSLLAWGEAELGGLLVVAQRWGLDPRPTAKAIWPEATRLRLLGQR